jgi:hypothetical protein
MSHECSECNRPVTSCECPPPLKCKHGKMLLTNGKGCACIECERDQIAALQAKIAEIQEENMRLQGIINGLELNQIYTRFRDDR